MARALGHELRTPLSPILGITEILLAEEAGELTESQRRLLLSLERCGQRLSGLVEQLVSLFETHSPTPEAPTRVPVAALVKDAIARSDRMHAARGATIEIAGLTEGLEVEGSASQLTLALVGVISNAIRFSPHAVPIRLAISRSGSNVLIRVSDEGVGIPKKEMRRVFEHFYRATATPQTLGQGAGLGLTVAERIIERQRGTMDIESREGNGTTVTIGLPLAEALPARPPSTES